MKFAHELRKQIATQYIAHLKSLNTINGALTTNNYFEPLIKIGDQIRKNPDIKKYMKKYEVYWVLDTLTLKFMKNHKTSKTESITVHDNENKAIDVAEEVLRFFERIPYENYFHFKLPLTIPDNAAAIRLTKDVCIISKGRDGVKPPSTIPIDAPNSQIGMSNSYLQVRVEGYDELAQAEATSIFKRFSYIANEDGFIRSAKWDRHLDQSRIGTLSNLENTMAFNARKDSEGDTLEEISLPYEIRSYMAGMQIKNDTFIFAQSRPNNPKSITSLLLGPPETFEEQVKRKCGMFSKLHDPEYVSEPNHIFSAIEWGFDGEANPNETMGFIQTCIGLEALLGAKEEEKYEERIGTTERLAIRCAYLLGKTPSTREKISTRFKKIYNLRSVLVHGMQQKIAEAHSATVNDAKDILQQLIYREIMLQK